MALRERVQQQRFESTAQEAMISLLVVAAHVQCELGEVCAQHGITHDQYNVLRILRGVFPHGRPRFEIAERLVDRSPDVTRLLDRLERQGLVERTRSAEDRRLSLSHITETGMKLLDDMAPKIHAVHERFASRLSAEQQGELARLCSAMLP